MALSLIYCKQSGSFASSYFSYLKIQISHLAVYMFSFLIDLTQSRFSANFQNRTKSENSKKVQAACAGKRDNRKTELTQKTNLSSPAEERKI